MFQSQTKLKNDDEILIQEKSMDDFRDELWAKTFNLNLD
jgi:hypothetical protein